MLVFTHYRHDSEPHRQAVPTESHRLLGSGAPVALNQRLARPGALTGLGAWPPSSTPGSSRIHGVDPLRLTSHGAIGAVSASDMVGRAIFLCNAFSAARQPSHSAGVTYIDDNPALTSLSGLDALTSVGDDMSIAYNAALTSLSGLDTLTFVGYDLSIYDNSSLCNDEAAALCTDLGSGLGGSCTHYDNGGTCP